MRTALLKRIKKDKDFRIKAFLCLSLIFNFAYASLLFVVSQIYSSRWFFVMSIYYAMLAIARICIFVQIKRGNLREKILIMRACGCFLFFLNFTVGVMMFILIYTPQNIRHHEITVITLATYTFSTLTIAIVGGIKYVKRRDYVYSCVKIISLISASVSLVTLTNTMLTTFGEDTLRLQKIILPILSGVVSIFILACATFMIAKSNFALRRLKYEEK